MKKIAAALCLNFLVVSLAAASETRPTLHIYSERNSELIKPILDEFTKETKTEVKFLTDNAAMLLEKILAEGDKTPADLLLTVDAGNLFAAKQKGIFSPVKSEVLARDIPKHLQDAEAHWFGLSIRARTIVYNSNKIKRNQLDSYEDLGDKKWKGKLCLRTAKKVYNQSLVAMLIHENGEEKTEKTVSGWVDNLATTVLASDNAVLDSIASGLCDVGIVNSYYFGRMMENKPGLPLKIFWPNQKTYGTHVNVSGIGLVKTSKHKAEAVKLMEWLSEEKAQILFAESNLEYPANPKVQQSKATMSWGKFKANEMNLSKAGELQGKAIKLMDRAKYF